MNGKDVVPDLAPVVIFRFFTPPEVRIAKDERHWGRLVEATTGQPLYVRDRITVGTSIAYPRGPNRIDPLVGKAIGVSGCNAACEKEWKPLLAPKDAQARGNWTLYDRPDGTKLWAYRAYALYTHPSDKPGTAYGEETFNVAFDGGFAEKPSDVLGTGLIFRIALP